jgi:hypothetical protein
MPAAVAGRLYFFSYIYYNVGRVQTYSFDVLRATVAGVANAWRLSVF